MTLQQGLPDCLLIWHFESTGCLSFRQSGLVEWGAGGSFFVAALAKSSSKSGAISTQDELFRIGVLYNGE